MKAEIITNDKESGIVIRLISETPAEAIEILLAAKPVLRPIESHGRITKDNTWAWFKLPKSKQIDEWDATVIGNSKS